MSMATVWQAIVLIVMAFSLSRCGGSGECMTVGPVARLIPQQGFLECRPAVRLCR
jgi:hypothetical protein